ncbi:MAG: NCS2 family permease [Gilliamella sp.]|uniref:NCS2 family permease n=1 Tax=unclassified Gilliamella TaxID=2685620 RepID=UPI00080DCD1B|nr:MULTISPECIES: NCS2 family permease [Gilliamella]MCO6540267.1 NCS2 family permease [Gilliamella sp.]MCO6551053.1 NCS2 family permease [Gilliamella sp.]MCO6555294.1 NCS2 family permease [Gilliamella sp.]NUE96866.1 NCS2 family permease [Gilliamella sp. ESL0232]OCG75096.1 adenine permease PurP [Gilliamella apicola]
MKSIFEKTFQLKEKKTTIGTEIIAGCTTFLTMVYIIFVNPSILSATGMDTSAVFVLTCIVTAFATILMGLFANLPIALAPAMGLNVFFAYGICGAMGYSWQIGMGAIFWGSLIFFALSLFKVRHWLIEHIPQCLRVGISAGIGLFIAFMGFQNMGIVVASPSTLLTMGNILSLKVLLGSLGFFIIVILAARNFHAAVLISILVVTLLALWLDPNISYQGIISMPPSVTSVVGHVDLAGSLNIGIMGVIFSIMIVSLFDSSGTILALTDKAGISDEKGRFPKMRQALLIDSFSSSLGGLFGTSSVLTYIESSAGISVGGRTGLTAVVVGLLFLLVAFFSPLAHLVPTYATSGALIFVGILMVSSLVKVNWSDLTEATPAFITAIMMPFAFAITEGVALGFISYVVLKTFTGKFKQLNLCVIIFALLFALKFIFIDHH